MGLTSVDKLIKYGTFPGINSAYQIIFQKNGTGLNFPGVSSRSITGSKIHFHQFEGFALLSISV